MGAKNNTNASKSSKSTRIQLLVLDLFLIVAIASLVVLWNDSKTPEPVYEMFDVKRSNIENVTLATGKISPRNLVQVKPQISGIISQVLKEPGDKISANEVIAVIGVVPEMASLNQAQSRVDVAEINLNLTEENYKRQKHLYDNKVISKQEMDKYEAEYQRAKVEVNNSLDALSIARSGVSKSAGGHTRVRSTINGTILNIPVKVGTSVIQSNTFNDGTTIATVADMGDMIFVGNIDESEIDKVQIGMPVNITIGALENRTFAAELEYIAPQGEEVNGAILFEIKAAVNVPPDVTVRSGYSANAEMLLSNAENVIVVPESAVFMEGEDRLPFVYVHRKGADKKAGFEKCYVTLGLSDGVFVQIKGGLLMEGDKIRGNIKSQK